MLAMCKFLFGLDWAWHQHAYCQRLVVYVLWAAACLLFPFEISLHWTTVALGVKLYHKRAWLCGWIHISEFSTVFLFVFIWQRLLCSVDWKWKFMKGNWTPWNSNFSFRTEQNLHRFVLPAICLEDMKHRRKYLSSSCCPLIDVPPERNNCKHRISAGGLRFTREERKKKFWRYCVKKVTGQCCSRCLHGKGPLTGGSDRLLSSNLEIQDFLLKIFHRASVLLHCNTFGTCECTCVYMSLAQWGARDAEGCPTASFLGSSCSIRIVILSVNWPSVLYHMSGCSLGSKQDKNTSHQNWRWGAWEIISVKERPPDRPLQFFPPASFFLQASTTSSVPSLQLDAFMVFMKRVWVHGPPLLRWHSERKETCSKMFFGIL